MYRPHTNHLYWPRTHHIPTDQLVHYYRQIRAPTIAFVNFCESDAVECSRTTPRAWAVFCLFVCAKDQGIVSFSRLFCYFHGNGCSELQMPCDSWVFYLWSFVNNLCNGAFLFQEIDNMKLNTVSDELQQSADLVAKVRVCILLSRKDNNYYLHTCGINFHYRA